MRKLANTIISKSTPDSRNVVWVDINSGIAMPKVFINGVWRPVDGNKWNKLFVSGSHCSISGNTLVKEGETTTLTVTPNTGYSFIKWSDDNTDNPRTFSIASDTTVKAIVSLTSD